jgi:hypothetical protein
MAFVKTFWDLKNNTTYSSHVVGSFDNNTTTGGGEFRWIPNVNNSTITDIAGMRIKPAGSTTGYWERVWNGPLNVSWFGCQNTTSTPYTFLQLGVSQSQLNARYGAGFASVNDNYDTTAIRYAFSIMGQNGYSNSLIFEPKVYHLTRTCELPVEFTTYLPTTIGTFIIDGNGATIVKTGTTQFDFFTRVPADQAEAATYINYGFTFKNFNASGSGGVWQNSGYSFLYLGATTNSIIENINVQQFDVGLRLEYCVNATIQTINTSQITSYSIYAKSGGWSGAGLTNSNSNIAEMTHVYINDSLSQNAGIALVGADAGKISQAVIYGSGTPDHGIYIDSLTASTMSTVRIQDVTLNAATAVAGIYLKVNTLGRYIVDGVKNTQVQTVVAGEAYSGSPSIYLGNIGNWPAGSQLSNIGACDWEFDNVYLGVGINTPADIVNPANNLWVTAGTPTIPSVSNVQYVPLGSVFIPTLQQVLDNNNDIASGLLFIGTDAGQGNTALVDVYALGTDAAKNNVSAQVIAIGNGAGENNAGSDSVFMCINAGQGNTGQSVYAIGQTSCQGNTGFRVVAIGTSSAESNTGDDVIGLGDQAGAFNTGDNVTALGNDAANSNTGNDVIALGEGAGQSNGINQSVIISNTCLPSYANYAAATAVITGPGATTGTYLYHDQATNSIGAVRIP